VLLIHIIWAGWLEGLRTSVLAFDIAQFFPSLNHCLLLTILAKAGLDENVVGFFSNYLIGRYIQYKWNNFTFLSFQTDVEVGQGSFLSLILSALSSPCPSYLGKENQQPQHPNSSLYYIICQ